MTKRVVIVGGVAGGMSCAARLKRLDEQLEVTVFERGSDVSFANCGMPYYIGGVISDRTMLEVQTAEGLRRRYAIDVRTRHEVTAIDRAAKTVTVKNLTSGSTFTQPYDTLVLATGASPVRPPIPGVDGPKVFVLNNLTDMDAIAAAAGNARRACVIGAGFIGLELAENLRHRGLGVTVVEMLDHVLPRMDAEMARPVAQELQVNGVALRLGETVTAIEDAAVVLKSGGRIDSDMVCLCAGVRPNSALARDAGLTLNARGYIQVDERLRASDPDIYAIGDVTAVTDFVTGAAAPMPLAGPANRQARIAADNIAGRSSTYRGAQGTAIIKVFNLAVAQFGMTEAQARAEGRDCRRAYLHPPQHPRYYPDAAPIGVKLLFDTQGQILGAQVVGPEGVDALINVLATAQRAGQTVEDLEHLELAYSPQWGGAKHPINMIGFVASNILNGDAEMIEPDAAAADIFWLDVREPAETEAGIIPGAAIIALDELRARCAELPRDRVIGAYCAIGLRGYIAYRFLKQQGFKVLNLNGGFRSWCWAGNPAAGAAVSAAGCICGNAQSEEAPRTGNPETAGPAATPQVLDARGLQCPGPLVKVKQAVSGMPDGGVVDVIASDPGFAADAPAWCARTGNTLLELRPEGANYRARIQKGGTQSAPAPALESGGPVNKTIICFSGDLDKVMAAFIIANGAAAMGGDVTIFFTFWGLNVLRKDQPPPMKKPLLERMFGFMMPRGPERLALSKMNMGGMGTRMMKHVMRSKNVMPLSELMEQARQSGVRLVACAMSMDVMGIRHEELIDGIEIGGVGYYLGKAEESRVNLFI